jgi:hypothetical protein
MQTMPDLWPLFRCRPQALSLQYGFEKAGISIRDEPIPWNADAALVEMSMRCSTAYSSSTQRKDDFELRLPHRKWFAAHGAQRRETDDQFVVSFRIPVPRTTTLAEIYHRGNLLGQITLPVLEEEEFLRNLQFQMPSIFAKLGKESVACKSFVSSQCNGLLASGVISSPTSLLPLLDLSLEVEFGNEGTGEVSELPIRVTSVPVSQKSAFISIMPPKLARCISRWVAQW